MTLDQNHISVFVIALNEADRIGATLDAARKVTDDLIVIDSGSTDGTQDVARAHGARVIHHDWPGYGRQKRFGEDQCRHDWVLNLDAAATTEEQRRALGSTGGQDA